MILAGDIGGTHTRLALFEPDSPMPVGLSVYSSEDHGGLAEMTSAFLADHPEDVRAAAFGVAGPVLGGRSETVNLAWPVDAARMAEALGIDVRRVALLNDLEANAWGIEWLRDVDLAILNAGEPGASGNMAVISAGTGLGQAGMTWDGKRHVVFATEGGHVDFAPADAEQAELLAFLRAELGHVSYERVCSGMGLENIDRFLRSRAGTPDPAWLTAARGSDVAGAIGAAAMRGDDALAGDALAMMVRIYGAQAGNLALSVMARGGVFVGGGIAPKILPRLSDGAFMAAFTDKGRAADLLERIPVKVILNELTALLGAARRASADLAGEGLDG